MKKIIGYGMLGICGVMIVCFTFAVIPDWRILTAFWFFIALFFVGLQLIDETPTESPINSGDGTVSQKIRMDAKEST